MLIDTCHNIMTGNGEHYRELHIKHVYNDKLSDKTPAFASAITDMKNS